MSDDEELRLYRAIAVSDETPIVPTSCDHPLDGVQHMSALHWCSRCGAVRSMVLPFIPSPWRLPYLARVVFRELPPPPDPDGIPF